MKKILNALIVTVIFIFAARASAAEIYTYKNTQELYSGVTKTTIQKIYTDRNILINCVEADLSREHLGLDILKSTAGVDKLDTVENLANTQDNVIAATNADFFSWYKGASGFSLGIEVKDGKLLQSPINTDTMAQGFFSGDKLDLSYMTFHRMLVAPNGQYVEIRHTNKHTSYYGDILLYTSDFNQGYSPAPGGEVVEMVVEDSKVKEFRRNMPSVKIPENGYVLCVSEGMNMFLANNFSVGDTVKIDLYATPDLNGVTTAFGGGTMLLKNGEKTAITHNVSGYNPRTAVGTDKTGKKIFLVTVDGRQYVSKGVTLSELADIMKELGADNALNLDGGGSTRMVVKSPFNSAIHTANSPTENRKVINALGIVSLKSSNDVKNVRLNIEKDTVLKGDKLNLEARIFDEYLNPIWNGTYAEVTADSGTVSGNVFTAGNGPYATITAKYNDISDAKKINVIDSPSGIVVPDTVNIAVGQKSVPNIYVFDSFGRRCAVKDLTLFDINSSNPGVAIFENGSIKGTGDGVSFIKISYGSCTSYMKIVVGNPSNEVYKNDFESLNASFTTYPDEYAFASYGLTNEIKSSGDYSGKLSFDFSSDYSGTKAAYIVFDGISVSNSARNISFDIYSDKDYNNLKLKIQFTDGNLNKALRYVIKDSLSAGWQSVNFAIPDSAARPLTVTRIYIVQENPNEKNKGFVCFDNLVIGEENSSSVIEPVKSNIYALDNYSDKKGNFTFKIAGNADSFTSLFDKVSYSRSLNKMSDASRYGFVGARNYSVADAGKTPFDNSKTSSFSNEYITHINLRVNLLSITSGGSDQWDYLKNALSSSQNNVFVTLQGKFDLSSVEGSALRAILKDSKKNVYLVYSSEKNYIDIDENLHIFGISNSSNGISAEAKKAESNLLTFNISANEINYFFSNIWE